jgi:hydrogenase maturation protease
MGKRLQNNGGPNRFGRSNGKTVEREVLKRSKRVLILGLGNTLRGDDGVGGAVIAALAERRDFPAWVDLIDGGLAGMKILSLLEGYEQAIIIDAADRQLVQGRWARLDLDELMVRSMFSTAFGTLHEADLVDVLVIGQAMEVLPENITIYAVRAMNVDGGVALSSAVADAIPIICQAIMSEIEGAG